MACAVCPFGSLYSHDTTRHAHDTQRPMSSGGWMARACCTVSVLLVCAYRWRAEQYMSERACVRAKERRRSLAPTATSASAATATADGRPAALGLLAPTCGGLAGGLALCRLVLRAHAVDPHLLSVDLGL
jgi:hypothetical protein